MAVWMGGQLTHHHGKVSYACRPDDVGARGSLAAASQYAVVHGAQFIGMIALVGARPRVHEREHTADK